MKQSENLTLFVTCPLGLQYALEKELDGIGAQSLKAVPAGVACDVDMETLYRILLWSSIANRVILQLLSSKASTGDDIYAIASSLDWQSHFSVEKSFAVDFWGTNADITNSTFGALRVKDAVVDQFRQQTGQRPSVSKTEPDIRISARLSKGSLSLGLDLSGESLHKRAYRSLAGKAPLKENLGAGLLALCGWPEQYQQNACFIDPMCGSGTLLIEAAMKVVRKAPGLDRKHWGFYAWQMHDEELWLAILSEAKQKYCKAVSEYKGRIVGFDQDAEIVKRAWQNVENAGLQELIHVEKRPLEEFSLFEKLKEGLLLTNPPYGKRLGEVEGLQGLYQKLGQQFERHLIGWRAGVFTGNVDLGKSIAWRSHKQYKLYNGSIESQLLLFQLEEKNRFQEEWRSPEQRLTEPEYWKISHPERAEMFKNRLIKNKKNISKWASKQGITCYRLYDADMPEFSLAIDIYQDETGEVWCHVQEYKAPKSIAEQASMERLREALAVIPPTLSIKPERVVLKRREIKKGTTQYEKNASIQSYMTIRENNARLLVNLTDYLDTGLFLDHRPIRRWVKKNAQNKRFLNLFCYTGTVTVNAALGGAKESLSVDMSRTYLNWAKENFKLNGVDLLNHKLVQQNCLEWLAEEEKSHSNECKFDLIFLDPPSFSNSKKMQGVLDIQRDHFSLIESSMKCLKPGGQLVFSCNLRKFKMDSIVNELYQVKDLSAATLDKDFQRNPRIHQCWLIRFN